MNKKKNIFNKKTLKVYGVEFCDNDKTPLAKIKKNKKRRYPLDARVEVVVYTNQGNLRVVTQAGFEFDGRSGPSIIDWYVPNLGTLMEIVCWYVHDCNGYGKCLSFQDTNVLLFAMLRDMCCYRKTKAAVIQYAVGISDSWYGEPKPTEWCYKNRDLVSTVFEGL